jgi:hypothetical protein
LRFGKVSQIGARKLNVDEALLQLVQFVLPLLILLVVLCFRGSERN